MMHTSYINAFSDYKSVPENAQAKKSPLFLAVSRVFLQKKSEKDCILKIFFPVSLNFASVLCYDDGSMSGAADV